MAAAGALRASHAGGLDVERSSLGSLTPISRPGGQGRVYAPAPGTLATSTPVAVKLYRQPPQRATAGTLAAMVAWGRGLATPLRRALYTIAAWPLATVSERGDIVGIVMQDVRPRFELPLRLPSGRVARVMLQLEHLLGPDDYLRRRGLERSVDTRVRAAVAQHACAAFSFLHGHGVVVSDVSPMNVLVTLAASPSVTLIDCDSMVFRGHRALPSVETADWQVPASFGERPDTPASDSYKLGLIVLRLFARSSDARSLEGHERHVPAALQPVLARALGPRAEARPTAAELERAMRGVLADPELVRRHPGPPVPRPPVHRVRRPSHETVWRGGTRPAVTPARHPGAGAWTGGRQGGRALVTSPALLAAWVIAAILVLMLFASLLRSTAISGGGTGAFGEARPPAQVGTIAPEERREASPGQIESSEEAAPEQ